MRRGVGGVRSTVETGVMPVEERGPGSRSTQQVARDGKLGNLSIPQSVQKLQKALQARAKENPGGRFYALYDKGKRLFRTVLTG